MLVFQFQKSFRAAVSVIIPFIFASLNYVNGDLIHSSVIAWITATLFCVVFLSKRSLEKVVNRTELGSALGHRSQEVQPNHSTAATASLAIDLILLSSLKNQEKNYRAYVYSVPPVAWPGLSALERGVCYDPAEYMRSGKTTPFIPTNRTSNSTTTFARPLPSTLTARIPFPCCCPGHKPVAFLTHQSRVARAVLPLMARP